MVAKTGATSGTLDIIEGDTAPATPAVGSFRAKFYKRSGSWYSKDESGTEVALAGITAVANADGTITVTPSGTAVDVKRPAITGDITIAGGSNASALAAFGPGAVGPLGSTTRTPVITVDTKGRVSALTDATIAFPTALPPNGAAGGDLAGTYPNPTVGLNAVTNAKLAQMVAHTYKGNNTGATANAIDVTSTQLTADLNAATTALQGMMSAVDKSFSGNYFDKATFNVLDHGISPSNSDTVNSTAWTALMTAVPDNGTVFFPPNTSAYQFASACAIPAGKHLTILGAGNQKSVIQITSATANIFTCGDWFQTFRGLKFTSSVTRTAGAAINSGNNVAVSVYDCDFAGMWDGIFYTGGANAGNLATVNNCGFTGTLNRAVILDGQNANTLISNVVVDGTSGVCQAGLNLLQCGSVVVTQCDFIHSVNNLLISPLVSLGVFSAYFVNVFFDTSSASSVKFSGAGNVQRVKFVNCWFSSSVIGCEFASTAATLPTAIDFVNCDIFANSGRGIYLNGVQDISVNSSRISANTTAGIEAVASAGAVTKLNLQNNTIGPTAGFGGNGTGVLINAGTYGGYIVTGNNVAGNTSNLNIINNGSVATSDLGDVDDNVGHLFSGAIASLATTVAVPITTETLVLSARVPANCVTPGQVFKWRATTILTGADAPTWRARVGAVGTVAGDTVIADVVVGAASVANGRSTYEGYLTIRSIGSGGTMEAEGHAITTSAGSVAVAAQTTIAAPTTTAVATNAPWFIDITLSTTIAASTVVQAFIEAV